MLRRIVTDLFLVRCRGEGRAAPQTRAWRPPTGSDSSRLGTLLRTFEALRRWARPPKPLSMVLGACAKFAGFQARGNA